MSTEEVNIVSSLLQIDGVSLSKDKNEKIICEWDQKRDGEWWCEDCKQVYCDLCNSVLHSNPKYEKHNYSKIQKTKINLEICRCGRGATKSPISCTTLRCPCVKQNLKCISCKCVNCNNTL